MQFSRITVRSQARAILVSILLILCVGGVAYAKESPYIHQVFKKHANVIQTKELSAAMHPLTQTPSPTAASKLAPSPSVVVSSTPQSTPSAVIVAVSTPRPTQRPVQVTTATPKPLTIPTPVPTVIPTILVTPIPTPQTTCTPNAPAIAEAQNNYNYAVEQANENLINEENQVGQQFASSGALQQGAEQGEINDLKTQEQETLTYLYNTYQYNLSQIQPICGLAK